MQKKKVEEKDSLSEFLAVWNLVSSLPSNHLYVLYTVKSG